MTDGLSAGGRPTLLHCFADRGAESDALDFYGEVVRVGIDPSDENRSHPIRADAHVTRSEGEHGFPIRDDVTFDFGLFHPVCTKWAATTSISGDPEEHVDMIPSARQIARRYCKYYAIENVPRAPLVDPVVLNGRMFGLPVDYERAFETNFHVPQPPRYDRFLTRDGTSHNAETSTFFFSERSAAWWGSVKQYDPDLYPKEHLAKNTVPAPYVHYVCRHWLRAYEEDEGLAAGRVDYADYDERMQVARQQQVNMQLDDFSAEE